MSHGESCAGVVGAGVGVGGHKKLRRKRKELDALVPEDKVRRKSSSASHHDLLRSDSEDPEADYASVGVVSKRVMGGVGPGTGIWACLPGACTLLLLLTTLVGVAAALRLLMLTRRDLDSLHTRINSVEASSSELPAKFHESHVRLQELEKNQSALWAHVNDVSSSLAAANKRVEQLEIDVKTIKDSLSSAPQLSSLPKDVANLQGSVATFGSTLQDVQSSLKVVKQDQDKLSEDMKVASASIDSVKKEISVLHNQTAMDGGRESGFGGSETVGEAVVNLKQHVNSLTSAVGAVNASLHSHIDEASTSLHKLKNIGVSAADLNNVTQRMTTMEAWRETIDSSLTPQVTNLSLTTSQLQASSDHHSQILQNVTQSVEVVKGVERKLEGSQVQLASGVSDLKQQIQKVDQKVNNLLEQSSTPAPQANNETHSRKQRLTQADSGTLRDKRGP
ncbi:EF-hand calcium-binding domain-containing protein 14 isoform X2 [Penaeus vannamei]|uniref:EF-hand calcium-binding domain-containing protein 14 isoform X2 n=1 Tax=Penaeus vannamei TaxID=6689 RepID=UPI00387F7608